jgi:hypothetical protein
MKPQKAQKKPAAAARNETTIAAASGKKTVADHGQQRMQHATSVPLFSNKKASLSYGEVVPFVEASNMAAYEPYDSTSSDGEQHSVGVGKQAKRLRHEGGEAGKSTRIAMSHEQPAVASWTSPPVPAEWLKLVSAPPAAIRGRRGLKNDDPAGAAKALNRDAGFFQNTLCHLERRRAALESSLYIADEDDLRWCLRHAIPVAIFSRVITQLDRLFSEFLMQQFRQTHATGEALPSIAHCGGCGCAIRADAPQVSCKGCGIFAHPSCALIPPNVVLPQRWKCDVCLTGVDNIAAVRCCVCEHGGGLFLRMRYVPPGCAPTAGPNRFGHVACAMMLPELEIDSSRVIHVSERYDRSRLQMCCIDCGKTGRPCVQCHSPRCFAAMHASCAAAAHRIVVRKCTTHKTPVDALDAYCPQHHSAIYDISSALNVSQTAETSAETYAVQRIADAVPSSPELEPSESARNDKDAIPSLQQCCDLVSPYWIAKRAERMKTSADLVMKINSGQVKVLVALMRPEIMKIEPKKVRLARFLCLTPEVQLFTAEMIEGVVPLYAKEHVRRQTRRSGNTDELYGTMVRVKDQIKHVGAICQNIKSRIELDHELIGLEMQKIDIELAEALRGSEIP